MFPFCAPVKWKARSSAKSEERGKGVRDLRGYEFVKWLSMREGNVNQFLKLEIVQIIVSSHIAIKLEFSNKNKKFLLPGY